MINKLRKRIFLIVMISLSVVVLGTIILFGFFNYNNTINTASFMLDRFSNIGIGKKINEKLESNNTENEYMTPNLSIDGLYYIKIENSKIVEVSNNIEDRKLEEYALKLSKSGRENGIIDKYVYKVRKIRENTVIIMLMENEEVILRIRIIFIYLVVSCILSLAIIYIIAKNMSKIIIQPVQVTFEKQKQFISDASHELKTPLAVIEANADVLENEIGNNKWVAYIQNEIESMNKLVNELLLLAKIENTQDVKEYSQFDLSKEVELVLSMFESIAYEKKVQLRSNIQENITMNGDKGDIEHILSTLVDNAIKHTKQENEIEIELSKEKNEIVIQVKNMGEPIPEDEKGKIFERFYRIDKSRNRNEKRYGLGLAIAKSTVQKYNGKIEVLYKEGFTIFKVNIPA